MLLAADVVRGISVRLLGLQVVRVHKPILHGEAGVVHFATPVLCGHHPTATRAPSVRDLLVPPFVEHVAAVIMIAQDAQPRLALDACALVYRLVRPSELAGLRNLERRNEAAPRVQTCPVKVVSDAEEVVGRVMLRALGHLLGHLDLRAVIDAVHEGFLGALVRGRRPVVAEHTAPVADDIHAVWPLLLVACGGQLDAVVVHRRLRCGWRRELRLAILGEACFVMPNTPCVERILEGALATGKIALVLAGRREECCRGCSGRCGARRSDQ
mmetsp:Transcript_77031/g.222764  ORF Transcript_77031/g.222764 Transcript_77031/m.222764 type:complete len:270 (+) Transcript_77031:880-1689(+)